MSQRSTTIERDNPFKPGGAFDQEASDILRNSTISGDKIQIIDPSSPQIQPKASKDASPQENSNGGMVMATPGSVQISLEANSTNNDSTVQKSPSEQELTTPADATVPIKTKDDKLPKKKKKTCQII